MAQMLYLRVEKVVQETQDALSLHFAQPRIHRIWYKPGQFMALGVVIDGVKHFRAYSICTAPRLDDSIAVTVKRVPGGLVSNYLCDHAQPGMYIEALRPAGRFAVENSLHQRRQLLLFGAGSGITPLFSILRSTLIHEPDSAVALVYANRHAGSVIFREALEALAANFGERFRLLQYLSQAGAGGVYRQGRISRENIPALLSEISDPRYAHAEAFVCGPEGFMQAVSGGLQDAGFGGPVHSEHFSQKNYLPEDLDLQQPARRVQVISGGLSREFMCPPGNRILESALQQGVDLPYSCRRGICVSCMAKCVSGEVNMDRSDALTEQELAAGYILTCQARPLTDLQLRV